MTSARPAAPTTTSAVQPVHQLLSDFQDRANGGNGWLRYLTFDPVAGTVTAKTYSTVLQQFETDPSSEFTLPFPLTSDPPANIAPVAAVSVLSTSDRTVNLSGATSSDVDGTIAPMRGTSVTAPRARARPRLIPMPQTVRTTSSSR